MNAKITQFLKQHLKYSILLLFSVLIINFLPLLALSRQPNFAWPDSPLILNAYGNGAVYYDARIREIKDGFILLGNPWFLEHNREFAPSFIAADWLSALPMVFGASFEFTLVFGLLFWSFVFVWLVYLILIKLVLPRAACLTGAVIAYLSVYSLMLGPTSMQIVFPFLLIFLLAFLLWLDNFNSQRRMIFLIAASAASFYLYTYLWQAVLTILLLTLIYLILAREKRRALNLLAVIFSSLVLAVPLIIFTLKQLAQPYYWPTMVRTGFIATHWPAAEAYYSGRWIALALVIFGLLWLWLKPHREQKNLKLAFVFFGLAGLGFEIVSLSNVITGKELELAGHMVRFITVWLALALAAVLFFAWQSRGELKKIKLWQKIVFIILLSACLYGVWQYARPYFLMVGQMGSGTVAREIANMAKPLNWLENNLDRPAVVWANYRSNINNYLPILTKHYVLFHGDGVLNFLSDQEAEERYLVAGYMNNLAQADIEKEYDLFAGIGNAIHPYKLHNRRVKLCNLLFLDKIGYNCGGLTDAVTLKGRAYFDELYERYNKGIKPNIKEKLNKYQVAYLIFDKNNRTDVPDFMLKNINLVYEDQNFIIYKINYN